MNQNPKCQNCRADVSDEWEWCPTCGVNLEFEEQRAAKIPDECTRCGEILTVYYTYCPGCGLRVSYMVDGVPVPSDSFVARYGGT